MQEFENHVLTDTTGKRKSIVATNKIVLWSKEQARSRQLKVLFNFERYVLEEVQKEVRRKIGFIIKKKRPSHVWDKVWESDHLDLSDNIFLKPAIPLQKAKLECMKLIREDDEGKLNEIEPSEKQKKKIKRQQEIEMDQLRKDQKTFKNLFKVEVKEEITKEKIHNVGMRAKCKRYS